MEQVLVLWLFLYLGCGQGRWREVLQPALSCPVPPGRLNTAAEENTSLSREKHHCPLVAYSQNDAGLSC